VFCKVNFFYLRELKGRMGEDREEDRKTYMRREVRSPGRRKTDHRGKGQEGGKMEQEEGRRR
jgi:hypothetical protein